LCHSPVAVTPSQFNNRPIDSDGTCRRNTNRNGVGSKCSSRSPHPRPIMARLARRRHNLSYTPPVLAFYARTGRRCTSRRAVFNADAVKAMRPAARPVWPHVLLRAVRADNAMSFLLRADVQAMDHNTLFPPISLSSRYST
jgi:hypothetical protein